jgi:hypothetical protein
LGREVNAVDNTDCHIQVLRTDGGLEYRNVDLLCQLTGVTRQLTEPKNLASNDKAEKKEPNNPQLGSLQFNSGVPIRFW